MSLICHILGHRRSRSRATFDEKRQQWISDCRRCGTILIRERDGRWNVAPPAPKKLVPIGKSARAADEIGSATEAEPHSEAREMSAEDELERCAR